jgi:hypothetical protein
MFVTLRRQGYVHHIAMSVYVHHIEMSVYVRHIVTLLCLVDCNVTIFDTLWRLEMFVAL